MTVFTIPRVISYRSNANNGHVPNAWLHRQLAEAESHITAFRHRELFRRGMVLGTDMKGITALSGRFRIRTGWGVDRIQFVVLTGRTDASASGGSTATPEYTISVTEAGGATESKTIATPLDTVSTSGDAPDEHVVATVTFDVTEATAYEVEYAPSGGARAVGIVAYELAPTTIDEATNFMNERAPTGGTPIVDADRQRLLEGLSKQYCGNGAIVAHWHRFAGGARTRTSAVPINAIDNANTGDPVAGTHAGWMIDPRWHRTASRSVVPFEFACYASVAGGGGATVRLRDPSGNSYGSISFTSATPAWYVATLNLPESAEVFLAPQLFSDGVNEASLWAVSLVEWEDS